MKKFFKVAILCMALCLCTICYALADDDVVINNKADLLRLLNESKAYYSGYGRAEWVPAPGYFEGDAWSQIAEHKNIILNSDITISSDEINFPIPENKQDPIYNNSLTLKGSNFFGNNHTITITQGKRPIYPLFGVLVLKNKNDGQKIIKDLNIVYKGDVIGSAFARESYCMNLDRPGASDYAVNNINITVEGSILPQAILDNISLRDNRKDPENETNTKNFRWDTRNYAMGFAHIDDGTRIENYHLKVNGNIGSDKIVKHELAKTNMVLSEAAGMTRGYFNRMDSGRTVGYTNITIEVGGSIIAHSNSTYAYAVGFGFETTRYKVEKFKLDVKGDISALTTGEAAFKKFTYVYQPTTASAFGNDIFYLYDSVLNVGGNIISKNDSPMSLKVNALGIGQYCYIDPWGDFAPEDDPVTIDEVKLTVGGNVQAETTQPADRTNTDIKGNMNVIACAGFMNHMSGGLDNSEHFKNNNIDIKGDVVVKNYMDRGQGTSIANLWGYFNGDNNTFKAANIKIDGPNVIGIAAPIYHYLLGEGNDVSVGSVECNSEMDYVAGFATSVTQYNGELNSFSTKKLISKKPYKVAGFANDLELHVNHKDPNVTTGRLKYVPMIVKNTRVNTEAMELGAGENHEYIGGFVSANKGIIENCHVVNPDIKISQVFKNGKKPSSKYIGGFVGFNAKDGVITGSTSQTKDISVSGQGYNIVGGFVGWNSGTIEEGMASFNYPNGTTTGTITAELVYDGNYIGGYAGYSAGKINGATASVEAIDVKANNKNTDVGGFAGRENIKATTGGGGGGGGAKTTMGNCEVLVNDNIRVDGGRNTNVGGFIGTGFNSWHNNNNAQIGENIEVSNSTGLTFAAGYAGYSSNPIYNSSSTLVFGKIAVDSSYIPVGGKGDGLPNMSAGFAGYIKQGEVILCSAYVGESIGNKKDNTIIAPSIGLLHGATLSDFTVLSDNPNGWEDYLTVARGFKLDNLYFTHVDGEKRTLYKVNIDVSGDITLGNNIGEIKIAKRPFQDLFWGKDASPAKVKLPYNSFAYVSEGADKASILTEKSNKINPADLTKASLQFYNARHAVLKDNSNGVYDILGIKSGDSNKPEVTPVIKAVPQTGDESNIVLYVVILIVCTAGAIIVIRNKKNK